jgi:glycosyltransferase involved in cell wall biosynthesis
MRGEQHPQLSVIVPVLNGADLIGPCIEGLLGQSLEAADFEVIVVDNGSEDGTREIVAGYPVQLLEESSHRSPYAARNAGIEHAQGKVLAFTDADCRPSLDWLERALAAMEAAEAELVGGRVNFLFSDRPTAGGLTDALWHLDVARQIATHRACMTANLLVRRPVFDAIGPFEGRVRSGADGRWTRRATDAGFRLVYAPDAEVDKPARRLGPLLAKGYRIGRGLPAAWRQRADGRGGIGRQILSQLLPPPRQRVRQQIRQRGLREAEHRSAALWWTSWLLAVVRSAGCVHGWISSSPSAAGGQGRDVDG